MLGADFLIPITCTCEITANPFPIFPCLPLAWRSLLPTCLPRVRKRYRASREQSDFNSRSCFQAGRNRSVATLFPAIIFRYLAPCLCTDDCSSLKMTCLALRRSFHSDPKVVGSILHLNGVAFTIIGVTPVDYMGTLPNVPSLWAPVAGKVQVGALSAGDLENRLLIAGWAMGRLRHGVSLSDAQAELDVLAAQLRTQYPEAQRNMTVGIASGRSNLAAVDSDAWPVVIAAMSAVGLLLLIACANVASLLLARAAVRGKEIAVRLAIGASRGRLLRSLLTESVLIALIPWASGLLLAGLLHPLLIVELASALPSAWGTIAL